MFISGTAISAAPISADVTESVAGRGRGRPGSGDDDRYRRAQRQRYASRHRKLTRQRDALVAQEPHKRSRWWPFTRKALATAEGQLAGTELTAAIASLNAELKRLEAQEAALFLADEEEALILLMGAQ